MISQPYLRTFCHGQHGCHGCPWLDKFSEVCFPCCGASDVSSIALDMYPVFLPSWDSCSFSWVKLTVFSPDLPVILLAGQPLLVSHPSVNVH